MGVVVSTNIATSVRSTHATLNASYTRSSLFSTPKSGFRFYEEDGFSEKGVVTYSSTYNTGIAPSPFDYTLSSYHGIKPDKTYYFRAYVEWYEWEDYIGGTLITWGTAYGAWLSIHTNMVATCPTHKATDIHSTSATLNGSFTRDDEDINNIYFEYYREDIPDNVMTIVVCSSIYAGGCNDTPSPFDGAIAGLFPDTTYYFRSRIYVDNYGYVYGAWLSFYTGSPVVITNPATEIGNIITTINGEVVPGEDENIERGFEWRKGEIGPLGVNKEVVGSGGGEYSKKLENLEVDAIYYFRAYGEFILYGTSTHYKIYGDWLSFTTTCIVPTVTTQIATDIEALSVDGNGTIEDCGDLEDFCSKRGFEVEYNFSGTLEEYNAWKGHGFIGDVTFNSGTGLWEGTLTKSFEESGSYPTGVFILTLDDLICDKEFLYRARAKNTAGWGHGGYLPFTTKDLLLRRSCTCGIFTIMLCAYVKPISSGSVIKRRGFRWGIYNSAQEYDIHEDGNFLASATIGPKTISFVNSADDSVYDTIVDSEGGFLSAGFEEGKFIDVSAAGTINSANKGQFKIISVTANTITVNVRNTLVTEEVDGVTIVELYALYIVDLDPETNYYSVAYVAIEDSLGNWTVQEGDVTLTTTIANIFDFEGYDKVEFYKPEREQNYKKITRKIEAEIIAEQQYIERVGGRRVLDIPNHLIQTKDNAIEIGTNYKERFKNIKSLMGIEFPTPAPFQREDTLDIGFGRIRFKEDDKGVVNFMPDGEGLMLFRYRMIMMIRKIDMSQSISEDSVDYMATMELEEA